MRQWNRVSFRISSPMLLGLALMLLVLPLKWVLAATVAAAWHELCHIAAVKVCGGTFQSVSVGSGGTIMECALMNPGRETACILAGPCGSLLLMCFAVWFPRTAVCGFIHGLYNLIPVYPLDGGRALRTVTFGLLSPEWAECICAIAAHTVKMLAVVFALVGTFALDLGLIPVMIAGVLLFHMKREKLLANFQDRGYNRATIVKR